MNPEKLTEEKTDNGLSLKFRQLLNGIVLGAGLIGAEVTTGCSPEQQENIAVKTLEMTADVIGEGEATVDDKKHFVKSTMLMLRYDADSNVAYLDSARAETEAINQSYIKARNLVELALRTKDSNDFHRAEEAIEVLESPGSKIVLRNTLGKPQN